MVDISVVIVSWNAKEFLFKCLQSLISTTLSQSIEIIVVDNASTDGSPEEVKRNFPIVNLIQNKANLGFAAANNVGIANCVGRYICIINSDVKLMKGCLDNMVGFMDKSPSVGVLGPKIFNSNMTIQRSLRKFPSFWNSFCPAVGLDKIFPEIQFFSGEQMPPSPSDRIRKVDALSGCFLMVRKEALNQVGYLDERFFIYSEDIDWCKRFWNAGWEVIFFPRAQAIHYGGGSSSNAPVKFAIEKEKAILQYWKKHHKWPAWRIITYIIYLHHLLRIMSGTCLYLLSPSKRARLSTMISTNISCMHSLFIMDQ